MFAMDDIIQAYYQLKISVYIENAVRKIIKQPIGDYLNYENSDGNHERCVGMRDSTGPAGGRAASAHDG
jgi:hypothetical protein